MPTAPPRACTKAGCNGVVSGHTCSKCGKQKRYGWQSDKERGTRQERGYDEHWLKLRAAYLSEHLLCEQCERQGRVTAAEQVHHIGGFDGFDDPKRLDWCNLMALCEACHDATHKDLRR